METLVSNPFNSRLVPLFANLIINGFEFFTSKIFENFNFDIQAYYICCLVNFILVFIITILAFKTEQMMPNRRIQFKI